MDSFLSVCPFNERMEIRIHYPFLVTKRVMKIIEYFPVSFMPPSVPGTSGWESISNRIRRSVESALQDMPGYQAIELRRL